MERVPSETGPQVLRQLVHVLRAEVRRQAADHGLSESQLDALHFLAICNRYSDTPLAVAEYLGATKGTVSQTLRTLEQKGLLEKVPDDEDGRVVHCRLTKRGTALVAETQLARGAPSLQAEVVALLRSLQVADGRRTFGQCKGCRFFQPRTKGGVCGVTREALRPADTRLICREHAPAES